MDNEVKVEFCENDYIESDNGKLWFINVGLLNNTAFRNVIEGLKDFKFSDAEMIKIVGLTAIYLTSDLELIAHRVTPLIRDCLEKRFTFLVKLGEVYSIVNYFFRPSFITTLMNIFDCLEELTKEPYADVDILNPIAKALVYLEALTFDMRQNPWLDRWLKINGYSSNKYGVHYHCFMIPIHPNTYIKQFTRKDDETFLEKIEYYCFCKLQLSENVACFYRNEYYMVECIFDVYKGRYLGLLDMLQFICKSLNPTKYEIKHLLTLAKTGEDRFESINSFDKDTLLALANSSQNDQKLDQNGNAITECLEMKHESEFSKMSSCLFLNPSNNLLFYSLNRPLSITKLFQSSRNYKNSKELDYNYSNSSLDIMNKLNSGQFWKCRQNNSVHLNESKRLQKNYYILSDVDSK